MLRLGRYRFFYKRAKGKTWMRRTRNAIDVNLISLQLVSLRPGRRMYRLTWFRHCIYFLRLSK